jgi:RimJ/RimL family protein N-acetyltransferase
VAYTISSCAFWCTWDAVGEDLRVPIATPRLDLFSLSPDLIRAALDRDVARASALAPFRVDDDTFAGDDHVLQLRLAQLEKDPSEQPWLYRAAVLRETGQVVGRAGFHAPPDADGMVEIGYSTAPPHRRQGIAAEMAVGLLRWAVAHGATHCLASIRPDNTPSLALTERLGFERTGEQVDEIDGLEWIFTLRLDGALPTYDDRR